MKMELIRSSETSAIKTQTPVNYPKRNILQLKHSESLQTRLKAIFVNNGTRLWVVMQDSDNWRAAVSVRLEKCLG